MTNNSGTIKLSGEDALNFARMLYRPTHEEIEENRRNLKRIDDNITITRTEYGFKADIKDLDLSFLKN